MISFLLLFVLTLTSVGIIGLVILGIWNVIIGDESRRWTKVDEAFKREHDPRQ